MTANYFQKLYRFADTLAEFGTALRRTEIDNPLPVITGVFESADYDDYQGGMA